MRILPIRLSLVANFINYRKDTADRQLGLIPNDTHPLIGKINLTFINALNFI